ncbi:MAG: hypothetical protein WCC36_07465 [Gammaproteobacteria bacterium]
MKRCNLCWSLLILALAVIGLGVYQFVVRGSTAPAADGRIAIRLPPAERAIVLREMRQFLQGVQLITVALNKDDMNAVARAAHGLGGAAVAGVPPALMGKLPLGFKVLGRSVHGDFDQLALDARQMNDPRHAQAQLGAILAKCVACHEAYQLSTLPEPGGS